MLEFIERVDPLVWEDTLPRQQIQPCLDHEMTIFIDHVSEHIDEVIITIHRYIFSLKKKKIVNKSMNRLIIIQD